MNKIITDSFEANKENVGKKIGKACNDLSDQINGIADIIEYDGRNVSHLYIEKLKEHQLQLVELQIEIMNTLQGC